MNQPRIVAELGRPETPEETAARKAESSRAYRSSKTVRNLIAALLVILAAVAVIILAVPRGEPAPRAPIDVAAVAAAVADTQGRAVIVPVVPDTWTVNAAAVEGESPRTWTILYAPSGSDGFVRLAQGFDATPSWPTEVLAGASATDERVLDGMTWTLYTIPDPAQAGNISSAMSIVVGPDTVLLYGATSTDILEGLAASLGHDLAVLDQEHQ